MLYHTKEFNLRPVTIEDADDYFNIFSHPEVARYDDFKPITRTDLQSDLRRIAKYTIESPFLEVAVILCSENKMIGVITLDTKRKYCYLGYHFNPLFHGKGYATKSVLALIQQLPVSKQQTLRLVSDPNNLASIAVAKKLGFSLLQKRLKKGVSELIFQLQNIKYSDSMQ
jgi:[ribosomal protein S5]-alanine N-acetyltransferase